MVEVLPPVPDVDAWVLAGGEGRRMQGQDKGLVRHQGRALSAWVIANLAPQVTRLGVIANRNLAAHEALLAQGLAQSTPCPASLGVRPDEACWPPRSGPLAGMLTALTHSTQAWTLVVPCDTPRLPSDWVAQLMHTAQAHTLQAVVPRTQRPGEEARHHWVCALLHHSVLDTLRASFVSGERRVRVGLGACAWRSVTFEDPTAFDNINTLENGHGTD